MQDMINFTMSSLPQILDGAFKLFISVNVGIFAGNIVGFKIIRHAALKRNEKYDNWVISDSSFENPRFITELKTEIDYQRIQMFIPYLNILSERTSIFNMKSIYQNLADIKIEKKRSLLLKGYGAIYNPKTNTISIAQEGTLPHEFMHTASSAYDKEKKIAYSGFYQYSNKNGICKGLNEGYTELLTSRWFNGGQVTAYRNLVRLVELFEFFFDDPKEMENYYFNHNLPGFLRHMERFASRKDLIEILAHMDVLTVQAPYAALVLAINEAELSLKLYHIFKASCQDEEKMRRFEKKLCRSPLVRVALKGQKFKLSRENPYDKTQTEEEQKKKRQ